VYPAKAISTIQVESVGFKMLYLGKAESSDSMKFSAKLKKSVIPIARGLSVVKVVLYEYIVNSC
jgi:hypothetical protein